MGSTLILTDSCKKKADNNNDNNNNNPVVTIPVLTTSSVSLITINSAKSGGTITSEGNATITERGVCWSTNQDPTIEDNKTNEGPGSGSFTSNLFGLLENTIYYVRAYATNSAGTGYGNQITFTSDQITPPIVTTKAINSITRNTAKSGGNISSDGGAQVTAKGVCWSINQLPTILDNKTINGTGTGSFNSNMIGLNEHTTYYVRAYATNSSGTAYGNQMSFTTKTYDLGQNYDGGIIFYIDGTGLHGLMCAPTDQGFAVWGCPYSDITGATGTSIGTGESNTIYIVNNCGTGIAADYCYSLVSGNHSDWFLPSKNELNLMYSNLKCNGIGSFSGHRYWSSTQVNCYPSTTRCAWGQNFTDGVQSESWRTNSSPVRAVRAF